MEYLQLATRLARRGLGSTWPNPSVGALLVDAAGAGEIISRGWTRPSGRPHAERVALNRAGDRAAGATLYVTLEPCAHTGKTPPCAAALIEAGVARVVCAANDPDPRVAGRGLSALAEAGVEVALASEPGEAGWLMRGHVLRLQTKRPFIQLKLAIGADGKVPIANGVGKPVWVTGQQARAHAHLLRARADAILVGSGTVLADDPELTCRLPGLKNRSPVRVIFDTNLTIAADSRLLSTLDCAELWILAGSEADPDRRTKLEKRGARVFLIKTGADGRVDIAAALERLARKGVTRAMIEGGPSLAKSCLDAGVIDEAVFFAGSIAAGAHGLPPFLDDGLECVAGSNDFTQCADRAIGLDRVSVYRRRA